LNAGRSHIRNPSTPPKKRAKIHARRDIPPLVGVSWRPWKNAPPNGFPRSLIEIAEFLYRQPLLKALPQIAVLNAN